MGDLARRFKFFGIGMLMSILLILFFFGRRSSCRNYLSNYLPNGRVLSEVKFLPIYYDSVAMASLEKMGIDTAYINQKALVKGEIDFERSAPREKPCGKYILNYQDSLHTLEVHFTKCKEEVHITRIKE